MNCKGFLRKKCLLTVMVFVLMFLVFVQLHSVVYAVNDISASENSIDTSELTSEDWSKIQEEINSAINSEVEISVSESKSPFENIKSDDGTNGNDSVWFLILGIGLVSIGGVLLAFIIFMNVRVYRAKNAKYNEEVPKQK